MQRWASHVNVFFQSSRNHKKTLGFSGVSGVIESEHRGVVNGLSSNDR